MNRKPITLKKWQEIGPQLKSTDEAAELLGVSRQTIHKWRISGELKYVPIGRWKFVPWVEIERVKG